VTLQNDVVKNGGILMVVPIPEYIQISRTWENDLKTHYNLDQLPDGFSRERIMNRLVPMLQRHGIPTVDLAQFFRDYRDRFSLPAPYFYYACDGHWNPLGHFLAANLVAKELTVRGLFKGDMLRIER